VILAVELELVDLAAFRERLERDPDAGRADLTPDEREFCLGRSDPAPSMAARLAAKAAVLRALGFGSGDRDANPADIEVRRGDDGRPSIRLAGSAFARAAERGVRTVHVSLTHGRDHAVAAVVLEA